MRYFRFNGNSPCPETQNEMVSSSKGVKVMVSGLDHSGSHNILSSGQCCEFESDLRQLSIS